MYSYCTNDQIREFYSEFGATEESVERDVKYLMEWLEKQPHLPNVKDEQLLKNFLLRSKNQLERTKGMLERFYCSRVAMKDLFCNRDPNASEIKQAMNFATYVPTPTPTPDGYRIVVFRFFELTENLPSVDSFMKAIDFQLDFGVRSDMTRGTIFIYDYENVTMNATLLLLSTVKRAWEIGLNSKPMRTKKIYVLNLASIVDPLVRFSKTLVKKEFADRVEIWKNPVTELADVLPKGCLPSDYGGTLKSINELRDDWHRVLVENSNWFKSEENVKADLSKKANADLCKNTMTFGIEGSFRKIAID